MKKNIVEEIISAYSTPLYVFDLDLFRERILWVQSVLGDEIRLCYAMKANPFLTKAAAQCLPMVEVCSPGEYEICHQLSILPQQIVLSGVSKQPKDFDQVLLYGGADRYTIESPSQAQLLECYARENNIPVLPVLLRLSSGNQFGMDQESICKLVDEWSLFPHLLIKGIHFYSGTQKRNTETLRKELKVIDELLSWLQTRCPDETLELEYGPGLFVSYFENDPPTDETALLSEMKDMLRSLSFQGSITLELGRFLAASCGFFITTLADLKEVNGHTYGIIDGGSHHLNYYGQAMAMKLPCVQTLKETASSTSVPVTICGSLCTSADILVKNLPLPNPQKGDVLIFQNTGAYSVTEGISLFLSRDLPAVLFYSEREGLMEVRKPVPSWKLNCPDFT